MKFVGSIIGFLLLLYLIAALALFLLQRSYIYYPTEEVSHDFTDKLIDVSGGNTLKVIVVNELMEDAVIYFGGNSESVALSAGAYSVTLPDKTIYMVNYRGYGGSEGQPTEENLFNDAVSIFDVISENHKNISVIGRSLGSGVGNWLATQRPVDKLVLITPYDSILELARSTYPIFPVSLLMKDKFNSVEYAASINVPVLAILAENDNLIPAENSHRLIAAFNHDVEVSVIPGAIHNNVQENVEFYPLIGEFLQ